MTPLPGSTRCASTGTRSAPASRSRACGSSRHPTRTRPGLPVPGQRRCLPAYSPDSPKGSETVVKLGLLTAALGQMPLHDIAAWAPQAGYDALEVAAWPVGSQHIHQAAHLDVANFAVDDAARVRELMDRHSLAVSSVTYCENNLHGDPAERDRIHRHLQACIDAAALLGVRHVTTFIGRDITLPVADNLKLAEQRLPPLARYAADRGVKLLAENCPMEGWHPDGYPANLAYSPELWEWMYETGFRRPYDPSHLPWLGIDPLDALEHALQAGLISHVQAKDIQIDERARTRHGGFGKTVGRASPTVPGWGRYRVA